MLLEVCVDSLASARAAIAGGADRLELCSALLAGGLTPYTELLRQIRHESDVAVRCLIRPRAGDFLYMPEEIEMMCAQITELRSAGANGFVIGCLNPDGTLDCTATARLAKAANSAGLTLHRAIDVSADPLQTYRDAAALGIDTVLTSGAAASCVQGVDVLCNLLAERDRTNGPEVLIGAGVNAGVIRQLSAALPGRKGLPHEWESGTGKPDGVPPRGRSHGAARFGRVAYPADGYSVRACRAPSVGRFGVILLYFFFFFFNFCNFFCCFFIFMLDILQGLW